MTTIDFLGEPIFLGPPKTGQCVKCGDWVFRQPNGQWWGTPGHLVPVVT